MTSLSFERLLQFNSADAWRELLRYAHQVCAVPLPAGKETAQVAQRDAHLTGIDLFLSSVGWDLWTTYYTDVIRTADALEAFWNLPHAGHAILVLDGLSLREMPWLLAGLDSRGYRIHRSEATGAELPAVTNEFARALGFPQRSALANNGAGSSHRLPGARTECADLPWRDCTALVTSDTRWVFWHPWPDTRLHELGGPGAAGYKLSEEVGIALQGDDFWGLVERLSTGRRLVITADHGYTSTGQFVDAEPAQAEYLKGLYRAGRYAKADGNPLGAWMPPIDLELDTPHGHYRFPLGRRKWKPAGGYPTLTHGGLSILEVAVPFIEVSRTGV